MHGWTCPGDVIDACAAPGNKTRLVVVVSPRMVWWTKRLIMIASHLACLVGKGKTVFAFDKSETRAKVRCVRSPSAHGSWTHLVHLDAARAVAGSSNGRV